MRVITASGSTIMTEDEIASLKELADVVFDIEGEDVVMVFGIHTCTAGYAIAYADEPEYVVYNDDAACYVREVKNEFDDLA